MNDGGLSLKEIKENNQRIPAIMMGIVSIIISIFGIVVSVICIIQ